MAQRLPLDLTAEYRGQRPAGSFVKRETGEVIETAARLKFEHTSADGDVELVEIGTSQLDKIPAPVPEQIKRGDIVRIQGFAVIQDRGSDKDSFVTFTRVELITTPKTNGRHQQPATAVAA